MSELIQEYVNSASQSLRVDREGGVIRGVKLLGLNSRNGRRYRENALIEAIGLYEGAKVNINHPKGHPLAPRDYQDRLGVVRGVQFRAGDGLFGDLHFNPRHTLSEQLVWDAEHAPQNVGMSHNVLARTKAVGDETVVEAITKVQSIDLVADPATTSGLYEHEEGRGSKVDGLGPEEQSDIPAAFDALTLEHLRLHRPDLVREIEQSRDEELSAVRRQLDESTARMAIAERRDLVLQLLQEHDLPLPTKGGAVASQLVSSPFIESLMAAATEENVRRLVEERAYLVHDAARWTTGRPRRDRQPKSRDQLSLTGGLRRSAVNTAADFAAAVRGT